MTSLSDASSSLIQHEFIAIDEGHATLLHINEHDQSKNWLVPIGQPGKKRKLGRLHGKIRVAPDFDAPLPGELLAAFEGKA